MGGTLPESMSKICRVRRGSGMAKLVFGMNQSLHGYKVVRTTDMPASR